MRVRVIDLDGSITSQDRLLRMVQPEVYDLRPWGPNLRLACRWAINRWVKKRSNRAGKLFGFMIALPALL